MKFVWEQLEQSVLSYITIYGVVFLQFKLNKIIRSIITIPGKHVCPFFVPLNFAEPPELSKAEQ